MFYLIFNNKVVDKQANQFPVSPEMIWIEKNTDHNIGDIYDGIDINPPEEPVITDYRVLRARAYPYIGDQLDLLYWDKVNNTNHWQDTIEAIKDRYPKPN